MRNNNFTKIFRSASHLTGDECSPGCRHMGLQLLNTLEKLGFQRKYSPIGFQAKFIMKKIFPLKIKSSDMQNQIIIIIIMRWFPQIITYFKIRRSVLAHKICSLQVFQSSFFFQETPFLCRLLLLVSYKGKCLFVYSCSPFLPGH